jgi:SAM-dependent methyltransferase
MPSPDQDIYASLPLRQLLDAQMRVLMPDLQRCSGSHALLIGTAADAPPALPMLPCWTRLHLQGSRYRGDLVAAADEQLPFVDDGFDLVLLRHVLEMASAPAALLGEAVRVLAPGGMLVLTGMHPIGGWSPWFYWRARGQPRRLQMPWRLRHSLREAGLRMLRMQRVGSLLPGRRVRGAAPSSLVGGGYVLIARKQPRIVTPLRIKPIPVRMISNGQLSPGARRNAAS